MTMANCWRSVNAGFIPGEARGDLSEELCFLRFLVAPVLSPSIQIYNAMHTLALLYLRLVITEIASIVFA